MFKFDDIDIKDIMIVGFLGCAMFIPEVDASTKGIIIGVLGAALGVAKASQK